MLTPERNILQWGPRPCKECGKSHALRVTEWRGERPRRTSWADPDDGHVYRPCEWETYAAALRARVVALEGPGGEGWAERAVQMERQRDEALARVAALEEAGDGLAGAVRDGKGHFPSVFHSEGCEQCAAQMAALTRWREVRGEK